MIRVVAVMHAGWAVMDEILIVVDQMTTINLHIMGVEGKFNALRDVPR
jgi:hypothetical protein